MRISMLFLIFPLLFAQIGCSKNEEHSGQTADKKTVSDESESYSQTGDRFIYFTCPDANHSHIHSLEAGNCPECGKVLVRAVVTTKENIEFYGCPMEIHSHIRTSEVGKCPECGMNLKPMRLISS